MIVGLSVNMVVRAEIVVSEPAVPQSIKIYPAVQGVMPERLVNFV